MQKLVALSVLAVVSLSGGCIFGQAEISAQESQPVSREPAPVTPVPSGTTSSREKPAAKKSAAKTKAKARAKAKAKPKARNQAISDTSSTAAKSASLPPLLREVEEKYAKAETLNAEFTQVNEIEATKQKKTSSGVIQVKRPSKVRWETKQPDPNLLVSDGKKFWFYTPPFDEGERGQVIEKKSSEVHSKLANALLSGSFSTARDMKVTQESASRFILIPKKGTAGTVKKAMIDVSPERKLIEKVTLEHRGGNRSEISLSNIQLGESIDDEKFSFVAPANTDKLEE